MRPLDIEWNDYEPIEHSWIDFCDACLRSSCCDWIKACIFYSVKVVSFLLIVSVTCLVFAACFNVTLQLFFIVENGTTIQGGKAVERAILFSILPALVILWTVVSTYIIARQLELVYLIMATPVSSRDIVLARSLSNVSANTFKLTSGSLELWEITTERCVGLWSIWLIAVVLAGVLYYFEHESAVFSLSLLVLTGIPFLFAHLYHEEVSSLLLCQIIVLLAFAVISVVFIPLTTERVDFPDPVVASIVTVFVGGSFIICAFFIYIQVWIHPILSVTNEGWVHQPISLIIDLFCAFVLMIAAFILFLYDKNAISSFSCLVASYIFLAIGFLYSLAIWNTDERENSTRSCCSSLRVVGMTSFAIIFGFGLIGLSFAGANLEEYGTMILYFALGAIVVASGTCRAIDRRVFFLASIFGIVGLMGVVAHCNFGVLFVTVIFLHGLTLLTVHLDISEWNSSRNAWFDHMYIFSKPPVDFSEMIPAKRTPFTLFATLLFLNSIVFLVASWSHFDPLQPSNTVPPVKPAEYTVVGNQQYPICQQDLFSLSVVDYSYITELTYLKDPVNATSCGMEGGEKGKLQLKSCLDHYFTADYKKAVLNNRPYDWTVLNVSVPGKNKVLGYHSAFYGIKSDNAKLVVVGVRGSTTGRDWLEDAGLFSDIMLIQIFSYVVPVVYIWPYQTTARFVKAMSFIASMSFIQRNPYQKKFVSNTYIDEVEDYAKDLVKRYPSYNITIVGHSLGGATASIVGAKNDWRSFSFEPPGIIYSHIKYGIDSLQDIHDTSTNVLRNSDPVTLADLHGGETQRLTCPDKFFSGYCHSMRPITCHLMASCEEMNSITFNYWGGGMAYCSNKYVK